MAEKQSFAELLRDQLPSGVSEGMEKAASEAIVGEIQGGLTKEAQEEIVGTVGWSGSEFGTQCAAALEPTVVKMANILGEFQLTLAAFEKLSEPGPGTVPTNQEDMPIAPAEGLGNKANSSDKRQSKAELAVDDQKEGKGFPGHPGVSAMLDKMRAARATTGTTAFEGEQDNTGENVDAYEGGDKISMEVLDEVFDEMGLDSLQKEAVMGRIGRAALRAGGKIFSKGFEMAGKGYGRTGRAMMRAGGAVARAPAQAKVVAEKALWPVRKGGLKTLEKGIEVAKKGYGRTGRTMMRAGGAIARNPGKAVAAGAAGAAAGGAYAMGGKKKKASQEPSPYDPSVGAEFRQRLFAKANEDE